MEVEYAVEEEDEIDPKYPNNLISKPDHYML